MAETDPDIPSFNRIPDWLERNKDAFVPPVCNKLMHGPNGQLFVMYVGGPNQRKDFHLEEGEELFYMVKGDMCLKVQERGIFKDITIRQGEIFLLPGRIPHSPQRNTDTIGLVIERKRLPEEEDCIRYYMDGQSNTLFERWLHCTNLGTQIAPVIREFFASEEKATGRPTATSVDPRPPFVPDNRRSVEYPFLLTDWLAENAEKIRQFGRVRLFAEEDFQTDVWVVGGVSGGQFPSNPDAEYWVWQLQGEANLVCDEGDETDLESRHYRLAEDCAFLLPCGKDFTLCPRKLEGMPSYTMVVMMDPANKSRVVSVK